MAITTFAFARTKSLMIKPVGLLTTCAAIAIASGATHARAQSVSTPAMSTAVPAPADPQADPNTADIIVHALRRSETLQSVPAAITAFTATRIEEAGITKPADFIAQTPNVTLVQTQNAGTSFVVIRGIGQARNSEPSVAVVVDGVQQVNPSQFNRELFDVDQIEVLKGPQGGVYGRNAIGGAIVITTKAPTDTLTGRFKGGFDNGPGFRVQGVLSGPVTKGGDLKFRAGLSYYDTNGFIPNSTRARTQTRSATFRAARNSCGNRPTRCRSICEVRSIGCVPAAITSTSSPM